MSCCSQWANCSGVEGRSCSSHQASALHPAEATISELQIEWQCIRIRCGFGEYLMEVSKKTLLRLLVKALAQKGVRLRTQYHAVKVGKLCKSA